MVLSRPIELGSPVSSILNLGANATLVMVLGDISKVYVKGNVDEADIGSVRLDQPARIKVETFRDKQFEGKVTQISPMGTDKDNVISFEVKVSIDNSPGELLANMTANAEIILEEHKHTLVIPEAAIVYDTKRNASVDVYLPGAKNRPRAPVRSRSASATARSTQVLERPDRGAAGGAPVAGRDTLGARGRGWRRCHRDSRSDSESGFRRPGKGSDALHHGSHQPDAGEPAGEQAPQLPDHVRHRLGRDLVPAAVGAWARGSRGATRRCSPSWARTSSSSGTAGRRCRRAGRAPGGWSG